jgi:hypothetical protein
MGFCGDEFGTARHPTVIGATRQEKSLRISRWHRLNLRVLERVYLPVPVFFAQDDKPSGLPTFRTHARSFDIERLPDRERNVWPDGAKFLRLHGVLCGHKTELPEHEVG